jgi:hypothetical protein
VAALRRADLPGVAVWVGNAQRRIVILSAAKDLASSTGQEILRCAQNDGAALRMTVLRSE